MVPLLIARRLANQKLSLVRNHELLVIVAHVIAQLTVHVATTCMQILTAATVATALARLVL